MGEYTTISIKKKTKDRLIKYGRMNESFDELLNRLLDIVNSKIKEEKR